MIETTKSTVLDHDAAPMRPGVFGRAAVWSRCHPTATVVAASLIAGLLHALYLGVALLPDEGGFLLVAQNWTSGPYLYGQLWVDRPPLLILAFRVIAPFGATGVHLLASLSSAFFVLAAGWAGWAARGGTAARWSAIAAAALSASALMGSQELDGELLAIPFVMVACAAILHAVYRSQSKLARVTFALASGGAGSAALLVKQNFAEGLVFGFVILVAHLVTCRGYKRRDEFASMLLAAAAFAAGAIGVLASVAVWAAGNGQLSALWFATYTFRIEAMHVMNAGSLDPQKTRAVELAELAVVSGIGYLAIAAVRASAPAARRLDPFALALLAGLGVEFVGIVLGGNFWSHYLLGLAPMVALGAGAAAVNGRWTRRLVMLCAATTLIATPVAAVNAHLWESSATRVGAWLRVASSPGDSAVVTFSHPNALQESGLTTPYPYAWSLPVRTLDPQLHLLTQTLEGPNAPTWVVEWDNFNAWRLDPQQTFAQVVSDHYRLVATVCGIPVWLRDGTFRSVPPRPADCLR